MKTEVNIAELSRAKIPVGVSSCLLGESVRYDGTHKRSETLIKTLGKHFDLQGYCPEVAAGMGVPRQPIRLELGEAGLRARGVEDSSLDVTVDLQRCAGQEKAWHGTLCGYIFKAGSPSCGIRGINIYRSERAQPENVGVGLYANIVMQNFPALPVEDEARLDDSALRENFVGRVRLMYCWKQMSAEGLSKQSLNSFHRHLETYFRGRGKSECRALERLLHSEQDFDEIADEYILRAMTLYKGFATEP